MRHGRLRNSLGIFVPMVAFCLIDSNTRARWRLPCIYIEGKIAQRGNIAYQDKRSHYTTQVRKLRWAQHSPPLGLNAPRRQRSINPRQQRRAALANCRPGITFRDNLPRHATCYWDNHGPKATHT